jgi:hypothetical protein
MNPDCSPRRPRRKSSLPVRKSERRGTTTSGVDLSGFDKTLTDEKEVHARECELYRALDAVAEGVPGSDAVEEVDVVISGGGLRG